MQKKVAKISAKHKGSKGDTSQRSNSLYTRSPYYHQHIPNTDIEKLMDLQQYIISRNADLDLPNEKSGGAAKSAIRTADSLAMAKARIKQSRKTSNSKKAPSAPPVKTPIETESDTLPHLEMIEIIKEFFDVARQLPGFMDDLFSEDFDLKNILKWDLLGKKKSSIDKIKSDPIIKKTPIKSGSV